MNDIVRSPAHPMWSDLLDWVEQLSPTAFRTAPYTVALRAEEFVEDGRYVLRVEAPGVDPDKDVEITLDDRVLTVRVERREEVKADKRSEFRYGSFERRVTLPMHARKEDVTASYTDGILKVSVGLEPAQPEPKRIPVATKQSRPTS